MPLMKESSSSRPAVPTDPEFLCFLQPSWKSFSLAELKAATNNFSSKNIIGKGGYAEVYKGQIQDGQFVAIKRLTRGTTEEMTNDLLSELGIIVNINHPNAAKLIGFGVEGGMHLVLRLSVHGSLAELLTGPKEKLNWCTRYIIALGTAEGLQYLHEGCPRRVCNTFTRDIKSANILITEEFEAQICDFGLAKWLPDQWTHHTVSKFERTFGYLAPEYLLHGIVDEKTDVYAFGVVLLELITGRMAIDSSQQSLAMWAKPLLEKYEVRQLVDPSVGDAYDPEELNHVTVAASVCIQHSSLSRHRMKQPNRDSTRESPRLQRVYSEETLDADEYNSTSDNGDSVIERLDKVPKKWNQKRRVQRSGRIVTEILEAWQGQSLKDVTWMLEDEFLDRFPTWSLCGQSEGGAW